MGCGYTRVCQEGDTCVLDGYIRECQEGDTHVLCGHTRVCREGDTHVLGGYTRVRKVTHMCWVVTYTSVIVLLLLIKTWN